MTIDQLMHGMTSSEFMEWIVYYGIEPFGHQRLDWNFGMVASTMANCHASKGRSFKPADFMPRFERVRRSRKHPTRGRDEFLAWSLAYNQMRGFG